jgi:dolichyl-phosphate beta-glucosyltransferase
VAYRLAIVIPTYNEHDRLPATLRAIAATALPDVELMRLLIADNGSSDDTVSLAENLGTELGLPLSALRLPVRGKARALRLSMPMAAEGADVDGVLFMDADNATDLGELARFPLDERQTLLIASRFAPGASIESLESRRPWARQLLSVVSRRLTRWLLGLPEHDTQCGFKLVPTPWVAPLFSRLHSDGWMIDAELLARAHRAGLPVQEIGVHWVEQPGSKVRPGRDAIGSLIGLVRIRVWLSLERLRHVPLPVPDVRG